MQRYDCEAGESLFRQQYLSAALKKFTAVDRHFADFEEDQFDFHTYCIRKVTMRSYVQLLRMEDNIRGHAYFIRAAKGIIRVHLQVHDHPEKNQNDPEGMAMAALAHLSVAEQKKGMAKLRKEWGRKQVKNESKTQTNNDHYSSFVNPPQRPCLFHLQL